MKLPAVAIAAMFACGAVLGQWPWMAKRISSPFDLAAGLVIVALLIAAGIFLAKIASSLSRPSPW